MSTIRVDRITPYQSGSVAIEGLSISNLTIDGTLTASIQEGFVLVGGAGNVSKLAATSSFGGGGSTDITALNSFTASADGRLDNLELTSSSLQTEVNAIKLFTQSTDAILFSLESFTASQESLNETFATTGSNTFVGNQVISGSLTISGSSTFRNIGPTILSGSVDISGSINSDGYELAASSTETIPVLNDSFDLDLVPSGSTTTFINKSLVLGDGKILVAGRFTTIDGHTTNDIARLNSDGTVDTSFAAPMFSGSSVFLGRDDSAFIKSFATQSDGKIVVGGNFIRVDIGGDARRGIARLNSNGTLDTSFVTQSFDSFASHTDGGVRDLVIQNDGKIIFVGDFTSGSRRVNSDGTLDTTFNINQGNNQPLAFNNGEMYSVALLDSGSEQAILIGGNFPQWGSYSYPFLVKLNPNGTLDFGFGGNNLDINVANSSDTINKIKVGDDGYIYVAGKFRDTGIGNNAGFARITTTDEGNGVGAIDTGFRTYISGSSVNDFDFYDGDKILLGGDFGTFGNPAFFTTSANRFVIIDQNDGGLVSNWITDSLASKYSISAETSTNRSVNSVTLLPNDNVLVGGPFTFVNGDYRTNGGLASLKLTGFGNVTTTTDYSITADANQLLISSSNTYFSGDITASVISGSFVGDGSGLTNLVLPSGVVSGSSQLTSSLDSRYLNVSGEGTISGSFTGSFVGDGSGLTGVGSIIDTGSFATTGSNIFIGTQVISGSILVSGSINSDGYELGASSTSNIPVLNTTFNLDLVPSGSTSTFINKSLVLGNGKILVAGRFQSIDGHTTNDIARLNSDGTIDTSFTAPMFSGSNFVGGDTAGWINTFVTQSDDKIVVVGNFIRVGEGGDARRGIARLNSNGTLDTSFVTQSFDSFASSNGVRDVVIQDDGKIIFVGSFTSGSRRVNTDGTLDTTFDISQGNNQPSAFNNSDFYSVALLDSGSDQAVLIGGRFSSWGSYGDYTHLVKLNPNGTLDFGFGGINLDILFTSDGYNAGDRIQKIKVGDDGYIYIAGRFKDTGIGNHAGFGRVTTIDEGNGVGALDNGFRTYISGAYVEDFDFYDGDKILLGGTFTTFGNPAYFTTSANRFVIIDQNDGGLVSNWTTDGLASKYNLNTGSVNSVTLLPNDNVLVGGSFTSASFPSTAREGLASLKLTGFGDVTTTIDYSITADTNQLLISSSNTYFSGDITASVISGSFVGDGSGLTGVIETGSLATTGSNTFVGNQNISGDLIINGNLTANQYIISSSVLHITTSFSSGSTQFGESADDTHQFTGSVLVKGDQTISGSLFLSGSANGNFVITEKPLVSLSSTAFSNTIIGVGAGKDISTGDGNAFLGYQSGFRNSSGGSNTFIGVVSGYYTVNSSQNSFVGYQSGEYNQGDDNTSLGYRALRNNAFGNGNVSIGSRSGERTRSGGENGTSTTSIFIGNDARPDATSQTNQIVIGATAIGNGSNTVLIGNTSITSTTLRGSVSASLFSGSFVGDGSGLTGVTPTLPSGILSSSVTNFTDFSQSVDTRISSIVTGTGFATTGSNTFVGNQIVSGSLNMSGSIIPNVGAGETTSSFSLGSPTAAWKDIWVSDGTINFINGAGVQQGSLSTSANGLQLNSTTISGSLTVPGSGSLINFVANRNTMQSIRGNGAGIHNIVEQSDGNVAFTLTRITTRDLTGAITTNISGSLITGSFSDNNTTTSGEGRGARLRGFVSNGTITSLQIETATSTLGYEEYGQPANRQGIGYKAGDTVTISQSLLQTTGTLTITLRPEDIETYVAVDPRISFDYKNYGTLTAGGIISSGSISVGSGVNALSAISSIAAGSGVVVDSNYAIAVGLGNNTSDHTAAALFGAYHTSSASAQTIIGIASNASGIGSGAFIVGNGTNASNRSNLLVAQGNKVEISGSLDVSGSVTADVYQLGAPTTNQENTAYWLYGNFNNAGGISFGFSSGNAIANIDNVYINETSSDINGAAIVNSIPWINGLETGSVITIQGIDSSPSNLTHTIVLSVNSITDFSGAWGIGVSVVSSTPVAAPVNGSLYSLTYTTTTSGELYTISADSSRLLVSSSNTEFNGYVVLSQVSSSYNFANDTAAQAGGVPLGGLYHTSGSIKIRLA